MEEKVLVHISISPENVYIIFCSSPACDNLSAENVLDVLVQSGAKYDAVMSYVYSILA